jgi:hypothetical protein
VTRNQRDTTILTKYEFVFDVYRFCQNDSSSSPIDEEGAPAIREKTFQGCSDIDGGRSIGGDGATI